MMEAGTFSPIHISWAEALLRIGASMLLPLLIGIDRFLRRKPIDFRPFMIVALAACSLSLTIMEMGARTTGPDVDLGLSRVFSGVITGIGFLGAGAMFRQDNYVKGAGSAASIWAAGAIGLICGVGLLWLAVMLAGGVLVVLVVSAPFTGKYDAD
ncbi:MgtC/SapB family protein [Sphingomonas xinjiangensis]|uniref:Protein MgtC n=1 Tax=Sphingomonas xinjiangensis TaxID=643568 RepID=A0A840YCK3_9SPHN|nr:MgtC/SapB family protein [Sphingomonas xinjiangensis]MBB5710025.1 putative Mg2+ transporter-C (MgtC) family protein [Sphingomonas xinjiangensis]